ncbi:hypothetical protein BX666DRAFT_2016957 [Dichotomocladium elegans]|nr:hypothetical protein BX666DRAFT_2016957 [Dichotomocladium elegans]
MFRDLKTIPAPSGWTPEVKYIDKLLWSPQVPPPVKMSFEPKPGAKAEAETLQTTRFLNDNVNIRGTGFPTTKEQRRNVKIKRITDPSHPCCGAYGLFAAQTLQPRQLILDYLGVVEYKTYDPASDYVLRLGTDLSIDAAKYGNEARFCNDFRGVGPGPNVCFLNYMDEHTRQIRVGIFVLGNNKIRKGDELLVTYGKSFWTNRGMDIHQQHHSQRK